jgi:aminoglycoside 6'-N-acetyltransferase I
MIAVAAPQHLDNWARLRARLWPALSAEAHRAELEQALSTNDGGTVAFIATTDLGEIVGFAEASLRGDYVNGCETSPVTFLEGIYVQPDHRGAGLARALCRAVEEWGRAAGSFEMASDADIANTASHAFHAAVGFAETERVVFFRKALPPER